MRSDRKSKERRRECHSQPTRKLLIFAAASSTAPWVFGLVPLRELELLRPSASDKLLCFRGLPKGDGGKWVGDPLRIDAPS